MVRGPDPKSKVSQIVITAKNVDEEKKITAMKEIIARNPDLSISTTRTGKGEGIKLVERFLAKHNWPPGNSQTVLPVFGVDGKKICGLCGKEAEHLYDCLFISGLRKWVCEHCKNQAKEKTTLEHVYKMR